MISKKGPQEYFFKEMQTIGQIKFKFAEKQKPFNYVSSLSNKM
jgi:secreted Zn-dependent insulinase-like peptidase